MEHLSPYGLAMMKIAAPNFVMPLPLSKITWQNSTISVLLADLEEVCQIHIEDFLTMNLLAYF